MFAILHKKFDAWYQWIQSNKNTNRPYLYQWSLSLLSKLLLLAHKVWNWQTGPCFTIPQETWLQSTYGKIFVPIPIYFSYFWPFFQAQIYWTLQGCKAVMVFYMGTRNYDLLLNKKKTRMDLKCTYTIVEKEPYFGYL